jgi:arylsulfatase A-like enzyme
MEHPNVVYFLVDNLGYGELGCYGGGILRGADTRRIDAFAGEGMKLLNFAPEAQCTPPRSALMTGRYAIRSGNHTVALAGSEGGLVAWERTIADILSAGGYATACFGKWHIGDLCGRWPVEREPLIPAGAPLDHIPERRRQESQSVSPHEARRSAS